MAAEDIPDIVRSLIAARIDSVPELEAILLLRERCERDWNAEEAGERLYVSRTVAAHILEILCERGFFARDGDRYRYRPVDDETASAVALLSTAYSQHLRDVTSLIHSKPSPGVRQFAEAFRLRRDR